MRQFLIQIYGSIVTSFAIWTAFGYVVFGASRFYDHALCAPGFWIASFALATGLLYACIWWNNTEHNWFADPILRD